VKNEYSLHDGYRKSTQHASDELLNRLTFYLNKILHGHFDQQASVRPVCSVQLCTADFAIGRLFELHSYLASNTTQTNSQTLFAIDCKKQVLLPKPSAARQTLSPFECPSWPADAVQLRHIISSCTLTSYSKFIIQLNSCDKSCC